MQTGLRLRNDKPGFFERGLARQIGLEEAIVCQQIWYWCQKNRERNRNFRDGHYWVYYSVQKWQQEEFEFWSYDTVRNILERLIKQGYVIAGNFNKRRADRTKWYRLNGEAFDDFDDSPIIKDKEKLIYYGPDDNSRSRFKLAYRRGRVPHLTVVT